MLPVTPVIGSRLLTWTERSRAWEEGPAGLAGSPPRLCPCDKPWRKRDAASRANRQMVEIKPQDSLLRGQMQRDGPGTGASGHQLGARSWPSTASAPILTGTRGWGWGPSHTARLGPPQSPLLCCRSGCPPSAPSPLCRERRGSQAQARFPGLGTEPYVASRASAPQDSPGRPGSGDEGSQGRLLEAGQDGRSCWTSSRRF